MRLNIQEIKKCYQTMKTENIWSEEKSVLLKNFRKWSLKNHPDKIGENQKYSLMSNCKNIIEDDFSAFKTIAKTKSPKKYSPKKPKRKSPKKKS